MPVAIDGVIDLSGWDFKKDGAAQLKGEWRFVWKEFLEPMPSDVFRARYPGVMTVPLSNWARHSNPYRPDSLLSGQGYATYVLEVRLPRVRNQSNFSLTTQHQGTAASYVITDTRSAATLATLYQGVPGIKERETVPVYVDPFGSFQLGSSENIQIWMRISNFHHHGGGTWNIPALGYRSEILPDKTFRSFLNSGIFGICLIISLYHFVLFLQRREDTSALWFGCLCAVVSLRQWLTGHFSQSMGQGHSAVGFETFLTLEYITMPLGMISLCGFLHSLVPGPRFLVFIKVWVVGFGVCLMALAVGTSALVFPRYLSYFQIHLIGSTVVGLCYLGRKSLQGNSLSRWIFLAMMAAIVGLFNDILVSQGFLETPFISPYTFIGFILMQSAILSGRAARAHHQAEHLSEELQKEVDAQTKVLQLRTREAQDATMTAVKANTELKRVSARELSQANDLLVQSEKLSQLGAMVAGIGHEIANPIGLISMSAENCADATDKFEQTVMPVFTGSVEAEQAGKKIQSIIDELRDINDTTTIGSNRLKELSMALRTQSRMDLEATREVDINEVVKEAMVITGGRTKMHEVNECLVELPPITCYRSKIGQVVTNLLANAADALTEKVDSIRAAGGPAFRGKMSVESKSTKREDVDGVLIAICDNGDGVPESIREKIFNQFFTTKPAGVGTGLGLAMCVDIVKEHGGMLGVSDDDKLGGARFELWLPLDFVICRPKDVAT
ncbi:MAG: hypothetical protein HOK97_14610 [Deltaproteobacteria bacterium]|nr:hypothetical protein [Deltaproteobacteria bacterium]